jgi:hypothetical protein
MALVEECPVGNECPCFAECLAAEQIDTDLMLSVDYQLILPGGCAVTASSGSLSVGAAALSFTSGDTDGVCNKDLCASIDAEVDAAAQFSPDLLAAPISLEAEASADTYAASSTADAGGDVSALASSTSVSTHSELRLERIRCLSYDQVTNHIGLAAGGAIADGGFSTAFDGTCSGLVARLTVEAEYELDISHVMDPPGCDPGPGAYAGPIGVIFIRSNSVTAGAGAGQGGAETLQGVWALHRVEGGDFSTRELGIFKGAEFDPIGQPAVLVIEVELPPGTSHLDAASGFDFFREHDGDIDANGRTCPADSVLMASLVGVAIGEPTYTPRADFDLDGTITEVDLDAFEAVYAESDDECPCPADLDGNGDVGFNDLVILLGGWGLCPGLGPCPGDIDGDGSVGYSDLTILLASWGPCD